MFRHAVVLAILGLLLSFAGDTTLSQPKPPWPPSQHIAPTPPRRPEEQKKLMTVPEGFELQLVAGDPDVTMPINIAFDNRGRLWATMSQEYPHAAKGAKTRDTVKILEDFGPDGRARKITTFADNLNIPIGVLPYKNGAIIFSIPHVWFMEDTDGDGQADKRTILLTQYGQKDTHGLTGEFQLGFDGWVYACHGFNNRSVVKGRDGSNITMESGNVYRFKPDGTRVEHFTHGQVNPFGLSFDPLGNLFSVDCHTRPIYQLLRGATYPHFARPAPAMGFAPEMMTHIHNATAAAGITYYAAEHYPPAFRDNIFTGNVITNRVNRDRLQRHGSTYKAIEEPDLIVSKDPWFRPVDVKLGPDGAVYVADFYTRIIGHYEMPLDHPARTKEYGRIWRVVHRGADGQGQPVKAREFTKMSVEELINTLDDPNLTARMFAAQQLVERNADVTRGEPAAVWRKSARARAHRVWILHRLGALDERGLLANLNDTPLVRVHALRAIADRDRPVDLKELRDAVLLQVKANAAFVQRAAVEVLGLQPHVDHVRPLLDLCHAVPKEDTHLLYSGRLALRNQFKPQTAWKKLDELKLNEADIRLLAGVVIDLPTPESAAFLLAHFQTLADNPANARRYALHVARHGAGEPAADLARVSREFKEQLPEQAAVLRAAVEAYQERGRPLPAMAKAWGRGLCLQMLESPQAGLVKTGLELAGTLQLKEAQAALEKILFDAKQPEELRRAAGSSLVALDPVNGMNRLTRLLADAQQSQGIRELAAAALAGTNRPEARAELVKAFATAPAKLQSALAVALASSKEGADELLTAVAAGKASPRLLREAPVEQRLKQAKPSRLNERLAKLTKGLPAVDVRTQQLIKEHTARFLRESGDSALGVKVFEKNCAICHQLANKGAKFGPQLDGVGLRGPERLLEDILDPGRNVDQAFRATLLEFKNGRFVTGLLVREEGKILVVVDDKGKEQRHSRDDLDNVTTPQLSPMPTGLDQAISEGDLRHLLAFLMQQSKKE